MEICQIPPLPAPDFPLLQPAAALKCMSRRIVDLRLWWLKEVPARAALEARFKLLSEKALDEAGAGAGAGALLTLLKFADSCLLYLAIL